MRRTRITELPEIGEAVVAQDQLGGAGGIETSNLVSIRVPGEELQQQLRLGPKRKRVDHRAAVRPETESGKHHAGHTVSRQAPALHFCYRLLIVRSGSRPVGYRGRLEGAWGRPSAQSGSSDADRGGSNTGRMKGE